MWNISSHFSVRNERDEVGIGSNWHTAPKRSKIETARTDLVCEEMVISQKSLMQ